jgi:hypothetical protein
MAGRMQGTAVAQALMWVAGCLGTWCGRGRACPPHSCTGACWVCITPLSVCVVVVWDEGVWVHERCAARITGIIGLLPCSPWQAAYRACVRCGGTGLQDLLLTGGTACVAACATAGTSKAYIGIIPHPTPFTQTLKWGMLAAQGVSLVLATA